MLYLHGVGHFHPPNVIDNAFLESLDVGLTDRWILERAGIRTRRTVLSLDYLRETRNRDPREALAASAYTNPQMAAAAARMALERAGIGPADIGLVVAGGSTGPWTAPAEACICAAELGIETGAFDLNSGCSTFAVILHTLSSFREDALPDHVLVLVPEGVTRIVDYGDRSSALLFGDAATAAVVSTRMPSRARIDASTHSSSPVGWDKARVQAGGHFTQDGIAVHGFAIQRTVTTSRELLEHAREPDAAYLIAHQANWPMLEAASRLVGVTEERHLHNVVEFGNCGAAGAPSVLSQHWERFADGDELVLTVVGAGLTWSGVRIRFDGHG